MFVEQGSIGMFQNQIVDAVCGQASRNHKNDNIGCSNQLQKLISPSPCFG